MTTEEIKAEGYESLTYEYNLPAEHWMFSAAVKQLRKGKRAYKLFKREENVVEIFVKPVCPFIP